MFGRRLLGPIVTVSALAASVAAGCSADDLGATGDDQNITGAACEVFSARDKRMLSPGELGALKDPIAERLLSGEGCPTELDEITDKLSKTDAKGCENNEGVATRLVNDTAFLTGKAEGLYRGVATRECSARGRNELFISMFGVRPDAAKLPQTQTELIGMDRTAGVFNFYVRETAEKRWVFMGSSKDAIAQGYTCDAHGACEPIAAKDARCWACHESGGLNMKELNTPWDSWTQNTMPGQEAIFRKFGKQLGRAELGENLEGLVSTGNRTWNETRLDVLREKGAAEVLRPLFCTLTVNLQAGGLGVWNVLVNDQFLARDLSRITNEDYQTQIKANGQRVVGDNGPLIRSNGEPVLDAQSGFRFIEKGRIDLDYIGHEAGVPRTNTSCPPACPGEQPATGLVAAGIIDQDFIDDVSHIDFTRPVFSKARCDLLRFAPKLSGKDLTPEKIREGFKANLKSAPGAGAQLLANLNDPNDSAAHQADVDAFVSACRSRPPKDFLTDVLLFNAHQKRALKEHKATEGAGAGQGIIEFKETLPIDNLPDTNKAFDPVTCTLK